jgi:hypothetical protein
MEGDHGLDAFQVAHSRLNNKGTSAMLDPNERQAKQLQRSQEKRLLRLRLQSLMF